LKISKALTGRKLPEKVKLKISKTKKGIPANSNTLKNLFFRFKKGHIVSNEVKIKLSQAQTGKVGKLAKNWQGGKTKKGVLIRNSNKYKAFRGAVFERDGYACRNCKKSGIYIEMHHIRGFAKYPKLRFDANNCITLCKKCHELTDNYKCKAHTR